MAKAVHTVRVDSWLPPELEPLSELAMNSRWSWHAGTRQLFRAAAPDLWEQLGRNPVAVLRRLPLDRILALAEDERFVQRLHEVHAEFRERLAGEGSFDSVPQTAFFSAEFALTRALQTYSGGLGVLAGDYLKAASDTGLPLVGVGLLYWRGYFRQSLDAAGWQQEEYPDLNPGELPLEMLTRDGAPATLQVVLADRPVVCRVWQARVGRVTLLLLDTHDPANAREDQAVTDTLYGGDTEQRLRQEIVLGIGGVRALDLAVSLGVLERHPTVFHANEGHAGFLGLELVRRRVRVGGLTFPEALESARSAVLFTTHTPVPAGIDVFPRYLMDRYFEGFVSDCATSMDGLMALGHEPHQYPGAEFNMAMLGLRLSGAANGVSQLHGRVARDMFAPLWPGLDADEVPIDSVTNGVHAPTWVCPEMASVYDEWLPADWASNPEAWAEADKLDDEVLWQARRQARQRLITEVRRRLRVQRERHGWGPPGHAELDEALDPEALTVGFARRFAEYKRATLLLHHPERLSALLTSKEQPVQLVFAGKAHPRDELGKDLIRQLARYSEESALRTRLVFVEDYDVELAAALVQGVDLWLNTPRRPHEACGTSGQKAVLNGALHCSTLDGWWAEMADGCNGFSIGTPAEYADSGDQDAADAEDLYLLLERTVIPMFYERGADGLPTRWLDRVRRSLATLGPRVLASRMAMEYATRFYRPLAARAARLDADDHAGARRLAQWRHRVAEQWPEVRLEGLTLDGVPARVGEHRQVEARVRLGALSPEDVRVELLHGPATPDGQLEHPPEAIALDLFDQVDGVYRYGGTFTCKVPGEYGVSARVVADHAEVSHWTDVGLVTWPSEEGVDPA